MRNIVMARVDERLIHGQVMTSWLKVTDANTVLVVDGPSASNAFLRRILFAAAPKNIELQVMGEEDAAAYLAQESPAGERVFLLAKTPGPFLRLIRGGIRPQEVILGNMGGAAGRKRFSRSINASDAEIGEFRDILAAGVGLYCQMVPTDPKEDVKKLL